MLQRIRASAPKVPDQEGNLKRALWTRFLDAVRGAVTVQAKSVVFQKGSFVKHAIRSDFRSHPHLNSGGTPFSDEAVE